jgi:hypothetical protein
MNIENKAKKNTAQDRQMEAVLGLVKGFFTEILRNTQHMRITR